MVIKSDIFELFLNYDFDKLQFKFFFLLVGCLVFGTKINLNIKITSDRDSNFVLFRKPRLLWLLHFEFFTNYTKMTIVAFSSLFCENKKSSDKMLPPSRNRTWSLRFQVQHAPPTLTGHLLLGRSLSFCSCTTWFLDFDDSVRIKRAWLYKDPKVLALQAIASVAQ